MLLAKRGGGRGRIGGARNANRIEGVLEAQSPPSVTIRL